MKTPEDEEFDRIEKESGWRKRQIMAEDDDDIQDYKKPWVGLTDEEIKDILDCGRGGLVDIKKTEAKLKEKNT